MRQMRKMAPSTVTSYTNLTIVFFACGVMFLSGQSFNFWKEFTLESWMLLFLVGLITCVHQNVQLIASANQTPSKLANLSFLPNMWQFAIDWMIIGAVFSN